MTVVSLCSCQEQPEESLRTGTAGRVRCTSVAHIFCHPRENNIGEASAVALAIPSASSRPFFAVETLAMVNSCP